MLKSQEELKVAARDDECIREQKRAITALEILPKILESQNNLEKRHNALEQSHLDLKENVNTRFDAQKIAIDENTKIIKGILDGPVAKFQSLCEDFQKMCVKFFFSTILLLISIVIFLATGLSAKGVYKFLTSSFM